METSGILNFSERSISVFWFLFCLELRDVFRRKVEDRYIGDTEKPHLTKTKIPPLVAFRAVCAGALL